MAKRKLTFDELEAYNKKLRIAHYQQKMKYLLDLKYGNN